jgi:uncharacterized protein YcaQ
MAMNASLFSRTSLTQAVRTLGFIQYDPLRRPARAQDLILHQRVRGYRSGDLDNHYERLGLEENFLHVYGAMPREVTHLLHPRPDLEPPHSEYTPAGLAVDVLAVAREWGTVNPRDLAARFGGVRVVNGWGGFSAATTKALEELHYYGLVRVIRRENSVKIYQSCDLPLEPLPPRERLRTLTLHIARTLSPISESSLRSTLAQLHRTSGSPAGRETVVPDLLNSGELEYEVVDGVRYVWPAGMFERTPVTVPKRVRFLAPFDPVVWDRRRFEHLWGWAYRFEAYTPKSKRQFGYYALPVFWGDRAVGWVNCAIVDGSLAIDLQFSGRTLNSRRFTSALEHEVARLADMVLTGGPRSGHVVRPGVGLDPRRDWAPYANE